MTKKRNNFCIRDREHTHTHTQIIAHTTLRSGRARKKTLEFKMKLYYERSWEP